jgi:hypothetical protein
VLLRFTHKVVAIALALVCGVASHLLAQRPMVEVGGGFGISTTQARDFILNGYLSLQQTLSSRVNIGVDASVNANDARVCGPLISGCVLEFPDISGLVLPLSLHLSRFSLGAGPGVFYLHGSIPAHQYVGGMGAHADMVLAHIGPSALTASIRPLLALGGARSEGDRIGVVPITIGWRW